MADFVRDAIGRFARTAGRRAGKKVKKGLKKAARSELEKLEARAGEKFDELRSNRELAKAQDQVDAAEKAVARAKLEQDLAATDGEHEHAEKLRINADLRLAKAKRRQVELKRGK